MSEHVVPVRVYLAVFAALLVLTAVTAGVATVDLGIWNTPVALGIAVLKAVLVILFFMHVKYSPHLIWIAIGAAFFWLLTFFAGTAADYLSRGYLGTPGS